MKIINIAAKLAKLYLPISLILLFLFATIPTNVTAQTNVVSGIVITSAPGAPEYQFHATQLDCLGPSGEYTYPDYVCVDLQSPKFSLSTYFVAWLHRNTYTSGAGFEPTHYYAPSGSTTIPLEHARFCLDNPNCWSSETGSLGTGALVRSNSGSVDCERYTGIEYICYVPYDVRTIADTNIHRVDFCINSDLDSYWAESNKCAYAQFRVIPIPTPLPDLVINNLVPPLLSIILPGTVHFSGHIRNIGQATTTQNTNALLFIDKDFNSSPGLDYPNLNNPTDIASALRNASPLFPGARQEVSWDIPNIASGAHAFAICTDVGNLVTESNENNNCSAAVFVVPYPPSAFQMRPSTTNTAPACRLPGQTYQPYVDASWTPSENITGYALYRFVRSPDGNIRTEGPLALPLSQTSVHDTNVQPGHSYNYAVLAYNATYGTYTWANNTPQSSPTTDASAGFIPVPATPPACQPPTIQSLEIRQGSGINPTGGFQGRSGTSGNQSSQRGSNWHNPIDITLNANRGSADIQEYYVALYDQNRGQTSSFNDLQSKINGNSQNGIILRYESNGNTSVSFDGNRWENIPDTPRDLPVGCTRFVNCDFQVARQVPDRPNSAKWRLFYYASFGSKNLFTAGYVKDNNSPALSDFRGEIATAP